MMVRHGLKSREAMIWSFIKLVGAGLFLVGLWVQPTALIFALFTISLIVFRNKIPTAQKYPVEFHILLVIGYLSLMLLGPGLFAIDLPL